jgi:excisionase family DNA binding protein
MNEKQLKKVQLFTISEAAKILKRSESTIRRWIRNGEIAYLKVKKGVVRKGVDYRFKYEHLMDAFDYHAPARVEEDREFWEKNYSLRTVAAILRIQYDSFNSNERKKIPKKMISKHGREVGVSRDWLDDRIASY